jgi:hypothetical protein
MMSEHLILDTQELDAYYFNDVLDPCLLAAQAKAPKLLKTIHLLTLPHAVLFRHNSGRWQVIKMENHTLVNEIDCWDYIPNPGKNVLPSTWAFKIKHYPDGCVKKFKACFCARGDRQTEGVNYFETWAPVVMWSTVCIVMVLAATLDLISVQCDITVAFIHARIPATETIYVHQPRGFQRGNGDQVLRLTQTLYGLKQSPQYSFEYISKHLINTGLTPSKFDPCLFMSTSLIVIVYVDNILIYGQCDEDITKLIKLL